MRELRSKTTTIALVFIGAAIAIYPLVSFAQDSQQGPAGKIVAGKTKRGVSQAGRYGTDSAIAQTFTLPPLPGEQGAMDSAQEEDKFTGGGQAPDFGVNDKQNTNVSLPPLRGLSQILDSEVTKNYVKKAITSKTAVLMQTMMMVENGAATGFGQAMNMGSNFYSNLLNTTDLQMKMMDVADETGQMKLAFVNGVAQKLQTGNHKDIWPGALYDQLDEKGEWDTANNKPIKNLTEAKPYDLSGLFTQASLEGSTGSGNSRLLSDLLFVKGKSSDAKKSHKNDQIDELKEEFKKLVGDVEITLENNEDSELSRKVKLTYPAPEKGSSGSVRRGVAAVNWEEVKTVWENMNKLLYQTCKWKQKSENINKPFKGDSIATTNEIGGSSSGSGGGSASPWELSSSPDITLNVNVLEQLYKHVEDNATRKGANKNMNVDCEDLKLTAADIPDGSDSNTTNFNDCGKQGEKKGCLKNKVVLHLSYLIARSRTLHTYLELYTLSKKFVTDPRIGRLLDEAFIRAFSGMDERQELRDNRARYEVFVAYMGQYLQGEAGAGNIMRPGESVLMQGGKTGFGGTS